MLGEDRLMLFFALCVFVAIPITHPLFQAVWRSFRVDEAYSLANWNFTP